MWRRCSVLLVLTALAISAQKPDNANAILNRVEATYRNLKSYEIHATEIGRISIGGHEQSFERPVLIQFVQPGLMRLDYQDGWGVRVIDGEFVWQSIAPAGQYSKTAESNDSQEVRFYQEQFQDWERIGEGATNVRFLGEESAEVNGTKTECVVIEVTYAAGSKLSHDRQRTFWIDRNRYVPLRVSFDEKASVPNSNLPPPLIHSEFLVHSIEINKDISRAVFDYAPPKDAMYSGAIAGRPMLQAGQRAAEFSLEDLDGDHVSLVSLRGSPILLYFWATWCAPCREAMAVISKLARESKSHGLLVLGLNGEDKKATATYLLEHGYPMHALLDRNNQIARAYQIRVLPSVVLVDKDGKIAWTSNSPSEASLRMALKTVGVH